MNTLQIFRYITKKIKVKLYIKTKSDNLNICIKLNINQKVIYIKTPIAYIYIYIYIQKRKTKTKIVYILKTHRSLIYMYTKLGNKKKSYIFYMNEKEPTVTIIDANRTLTNTHIQ